MMGAFYRNRERRAGRVQARRVGRTWRFKREWIDAALEDPAPYR
jgi:hypothetical protein